MLDEIIEQGKLHFNHGHHEVLVKTEHYPKKILISKTDIGFDGCANFIENEIGWSVVDRGILFVAEINSDKCVVEWMLIREF